MSVQSHHVAEENADMQSDKATDYLRADTFFLNLKSLKYYHGFMEVSFVQAKFAFKCPIYIDWN